MAHIFAVKLADMIGQPVSAFLPKATPNGEVSDLLGVVAGKKGGMGSKNRKTLGKLQHLVSWLPWQSTLPASTSGTEPVPAAAVLPC